MASLSSSLTSSSHNNNNMPELGGNGAGSGSGSIAMVPVPVHVPVGMSASYRKERVDEVEEKKTVTVMEERNEENKPENTSLSSSSSSSVGATARAVATATATTMKRRKKTITSSVMPFHCRVCFEEFCLIERYPVILPCGHTYVCHPCAKNKLQGCPECYQSLYWFPPKPRSQAHAHAHAHSHDRHSSTNPASVAMSRSSMATAGQSPMTTTLSLQRQTSTPALLLLAASGASVTKLTSEIAGTNITATNSSTAFSHHHLHQQQAPPTPDLLGKSSNHESITTPSKHMGDGWIQYPLPKNLVLMAMMEAAERQQRTVKKNLTPVPEGEIGPGTPSSAAVTTKTQPLTENTLAPPPPLAESYNKFNHQQQQQMHSIDHNEKSNSYKRVANHSDTSNLDHYDHADGKDVNSNQFTSSGNVCENENKFDLNRIISSGMATLSGPCGTYVVREEDGLAVLPFHPEKRNKKETVALIPIESYHDDHNCEELYDDDDALSCHSNSQPTLLLPPLPPPTNDNHYNNSNMLMMMREPFTIVKGQQVQVVDFVDGVAKLARGAGYIVATTSQLVKVGLPKESCCRLEGVLNTLSLRGKDLDVALDENVQIKHSLLKSIRSELHKNKIPDHPIITGGERWRRGATVPTAPTAIEAPTQSSSALRNTITTTTTTDEGEEATITTSCATNNAIITTAATNINNNSDNVVNNQSLAKNVDDEERNIRTKTITPNKDITVEAVLTTTDSSSSSSTGPPPVSPNETLVEGEGAKEGTIINNSRFSTLVYSPEDGRGKSKNNNNDNQDENENKICKDKNNSQQEASLSSLLQSAPPPPLPPPDIDNITNTGGNGEVAGISHSYYNDAITAAATATATAMLTTNSNSNTTTPSNGLSSHYRVARNEDDLDDLAYYGYCGSAFFGKSFLTYDTAVGAVTDSIGAVTAGISSTSSNYDEFEVGSVRPAPSQMREVQLPFENNDKNASNNDTTISDDVGISGCSSWGTTTSQYYSCCSNKYLSQQSEQPRITDTVANAFSTVVHHVVQGGVPATGEQEPHLYDDNHGNNLNSNSVLEEAPVTTPPTSLPTLLLTSSSVEIAALSGSELPEIPPPPPPPPPPSLTSQRQQHISSSPSFLFSSNRSPSSGASTSPIATAAATNNANYYTSNTNNTTTTSSPILSPSIPHVLPSSSFDTINFRTGMSGHRALCKTSPRSAKSHAQYARSQVRMMGEHHGLI